MKEIKNGTDSGVRAMVECALMIAAGTVLSRFELVKYPNGGSVTCASMVPFILISFRRGTKWGVIAGIANSLLQMMLGGVYPTPAGTFISMAGEVVLDYILAYTVLSLAQFFSKPFGNKRRTAGILFGTFMVCFLRFCCSFVSGFLIWGSITNDGLGAVIYSLGYNAGYMVPETAIALVVIFVLCKSVPGLFSQQN